MQDFLILIREDVQRFTSGSEADFQKEVEEYAVWVEEMTKTGNYVSGDPLKPEGRYILKDSIQTDGPFIESKEAVGGYIIIKAKDIEEATELARKCPVFEYDGLIELRPLIKM